MFNQGISRHHSDSLERTLMDVRLKLQIVIPSLVVGSLLCIYGSHRRWKWLVDPPEHLALVYSQSLLKVLFGRVFVCKFTLIVGWLGLAYAIALLFAE